MSQFGLVLLFSFRFTSITKALLCLQLDVHLMLISLDKQSTPSLQQPHLCCRPSLSVKHLCEVRFLSQYLTPRLVVCKREILRYDPTKLLLLGDET
jgi:hypothetical protein